MTVPTHASRRTTGALRQRVVETLRGAPHPLTGVAIFERLRADGATRFLSQTYRALGELHTRGAIRRVELTRSYASGAENRMLNLVCRTCGTVAAVEAAGIVATLTHAASAAAFRPERCIVELDGHCACCVIV